MTAKLTIVFTVLAIILACALVIKLACDLARVINGLHDQSNTAPLAKDPSDFRQY